MKVILLDNVRGIGRVGDIKEVSDGHARNFLLPRGLAKAATGEAVKEAEVLKAKKLEASTLVRTEAEDLAHRIDGTVIGITGRANPKGTLFAGIEPAAIADAVSEKAGVHVVPAQIHLAGPIKTVGEHPVTLQLTDDIAAHVVIQVTTP